MLARGVAEVDLEVGATSGMWLRDQGRGGQAGKDLELEWEDILEATGVRSGFAGRWGLKVGIRSKVV